MLFKILSTAFTGTINTSFSVLMFVLFAFAILTFKSERFGTFAKNTPALLTSVGILGTFVGIVIALMGFDDSNIKVHINDIIAGMQTAFVTSVIGVALSVILKVIMLALGNEPDSKEVVQYTIDLFETNNESIKTQTQAINTMLQNSQSQKEIFDKQALAIEKLANAIGSDSENSLVGQIARLRSDINDNHKKQIEHQDEKSQKFQTELFAKLDTVSQMISKSATEQVIDALRQVITDFNHNLTEQFGENFKELNEAVFKLVEWQDKYANQIDQMIEQYEQGVQAIDSTKNAVIAIEKSTQSIPQTMTDLSDILTVNQHQIDELDRHLQAFAELQEKATQALPETKKHIDEMINGITVVSNQLNIQFDTVRNALEIHITAITNGANTFKRTLEQSTKDFENYVKETNQTQLQQMRKVLDGVDSSAQTALSATGESIGKQIKALQEAQQKELEKVMQTMGQALATITNQFTSDYAKLVNEMNKIVRMYNQR